MAQISINDEKKKRKLVQGNLSKFVVKRSKHTISATLCQAVEDAKNIMRVEKNDVFGIFHKKYTSY